LALGVAVAAMTTVIVGLGLQQALTYFAASRRETARLAVSLAVWSGVLAGGISVALGWVLVPALVRDAVVEDVLRIGLLAVPGSVVLTNLTGVFQGLRLGRRFNTTRLLQPSAYCVGMIAVALIADSVTAEALAGVFAAAATASAVIAYGLLSPSVRRVGRLDRRFTATAIRYGAVAGIGAAALVANTHLAVPILGALVGLRETGYYAIALSYATPVSLVASAVAIHTFSDVAAADRGARAHLIRRRLVVTLGSAIPLAVTAALAAPLVVPAVFGEGFRPAVAAAQVLVLAQAFRGLSYVLADIGRGLGRPALPSVAEAGGVLAIFALLPVVVPESGSHGAAEVVAGANALVAIVLLAGVRRALR
jgi:O-antigen/teichoic acid export membrane protein